MSDEHDKHEGGEHNDADHRDGVAVGIGAAGAAAGTVGYLALGAGTAKAAFAGAIPIGIARGVGAATIVPAAVAAAGGIRDGLHRGQGCQAAVAQVQGQLHRRLEQGRGV